MSETQEKKFDIAEARKLCSDLFEPNPWIYWTDLILSYVVGYIAVQIYFKRLPPDPIGTACFFIAGLAFYRVAMFMHEVVHIRKGQMKSFKIGWNLIGAIPLAIPSFFYEHHIEHHNTNTYGTGRDGEYLPLGGGTWKQILGFFSEVLLLPIIVAIRFTIITPISFLHPKLRQYTLERWSSFVINFKHRREIKPDALRFWWALLEIAICLRLLGMLVYMATGVAEWYRPFQVYAVAVFILGLNYVRTLVAHRYTGQGQKMSHTEQFEDSVNVTGGILTELWAPLGERYHALHHLFPGMPYHNLPEAHRRIMAHVAEESPYRDVTYPSYWFAVRKLFETIRVSSRLKPTPAELWFQDRDEKFAKQNAINPEPTPSEAG